MNKSILLLVVLSFASHAKVETFTLTEGKKVTFDVPAKWEAQKDLFGIPLAILGPWKNESRPVLSVLPTNVKREKLNEEDFKKLMSDFKKEKEEWVQSHSGQLLSYEPATTAKLGKDLTGHYIGAEFKINNVHFIERSYYVYCKGEVYNLKYSLRDEHKKYTRDLQKLVEEFRCE